jgi:LL-diaminopimelate aminotransferase
MKAAERISRIEPSYWRHLGANLMRLRAEGKDLIRLDVGNPDMPPPPEIVEVLREQALRPDVHGYGGQRDEAKIEEAIAHYYQRRFGVELDPGSQVLALSGSKEGIGHAALAYLDPGDVVLIPEPAYPPYRAGANYVGAEIVVVPLRPEEDYLPVLSEIPEETARRAKLLWLNYPHNPTGATATLGLLEEAVAFAREYDLLLCHDAPYTSVAYDGYAPPSVMQVPGAAEVAIEFNSLSKMCNMAGWRVAMAIGCAERLNELQAARSSDSSGSFGPVLMAASLALRTNQSWIEERNAIYQERRDIIHATTERLGMSPRKPLGSLYVWAKTPDGYTSNEFVDALAEATGVSIVPGSMYGLGGEGHVRISVTQPTNRVHEAMERLTAFIG